MCQKTGNGIGHWRCDYWVFDKLSGKDANFFRLPILCSATIRVHDEDNKNPHVSCCESPTDDIPPIARWSFRAQLKRTGKELTRGPWHSHTSQWPIEGHCSPGPQKATRFLPPRCQIIWLTVLVQWSNQRKTRACLG